MSPFYEDQWLQIWSGDCREVLRQIPNESVHAAITSPPYYGLRSYGTDPQAWGGDTLHDHEWGDQDQRKGPAQKQGATSQRAGRSNVDEQVQRGVSTGQFCKCGAWLGELGTEPTPDLYVAHLVEVFSEVRRVLRSDGLFFLNLGDSYANDTKWGGSSGGKHVAALHGNTGIGRGRRVTGLKSKDLVGIPWRVAFALQDDGWWLRNDIIWATPNPMPESVSDRFTSSHEHVFMLAKDSRYFFDQDAVREPHLPITLERVKYGLNQTHPGDIGVAMPPMQTRKIEGDFEDGTARVVDSAMGTRFANPAGRNRRDVWTIPTVPYKGAHYAVFPPKLVEPMIKAATSEKGVCPDCGAPWRRVTERLREPRGDSFGLKEIGEFDHGQAGSPYMETTAIETLGWVPTCEHGRLDEIRDCPECGAPYEQIEAIDPWLSVVDTSRPQGLRAVELARARGLTQSHIDALRSAGITDAGKAQITQDGFGNNSDDVKHLAAEAKEALGGYTREFLWRPSATIGWQPTCGHEPQQTVPATVLDPFGGSGTVGMVAQELSRRAILIDLNPEYLKQQLVRNAQMPLGLASGGVE